MGQCCSVITLLPQTFPVVHVPLSLSLVYTSSLPRSTHPAAPPILFPYGPPPPTLPRSSLPMLTLSCLHAWAPMLLGDWNPLFTWKTPGSLQTLLLLGFWKCPTPGLHMCKIVSHTTPLLGPALV